LGLKLGFLPDRLELERFINLYFRQRYFFS